MPELSLTTPLSSDFGSAIRQRGAVYFRAGRVRIHSGSPWQVVATVRGSARYHVELQRKGAEIHASCTCPYFDAAMCKHVWAVVLAAEAQRLLQGDGSNDDVHLVHEGKDEGLDDDELHDESFDDDFDGEDDFEDAAQYPSSGPSRASRSVGVQTPRSPRAAAAAGWRKLLAQLNPASPRAASLARETWPPGRELLYAIDATGKSAQRGLSLEIFFRDLRRDGSWGKPKSRYLRRELLEQLPNPDDRHILAFLAGATQLYGYDGLDYAPSSYYDSTFAFRYRLLDPQPELILPAICRTGRCRLRLRPEDQEQHWLPVTWDDGEPWQFRLEMVRSAKSEHYEVLGVLWRGTERMDVSALMLPVNAGILFTRERAARCEHHGAFKWIAALREHGRLLVPIGQHEEFLVELLRQPGLPPLDLPPELHYEEIVRTPRPRLTVKPAAKTLQRDRLHGELAFDYDGMIVARDEPSRCIVQTAQRQVLLRDFGAERAHSDRLQQLGWRRGSVGYPSWNDEAKLELAANRLPKVVSALTAEGWHVEAEGKVYRTHGKLNIQVRSGVDWFELHGAVEFGDSVAHLPELLAAARRGDNTVRLGDGAFGLLPREWLEKYGPLAGLGVAHADHLRFTRSQIGLLDALLAAQPESNCDALFARARDELRHFAGIRVIEPPAGFRGELRPYQKEGLGWLNFLRRFGFGGCLADDMGLGKTVQVLALLEARRELRSEENAGAAEPPSASIGPSLVVVPKSLVFNWQHEIARFAPRLRVLDHTGHLRRKGNEHFEDYDVVLTTYGTLRNDAADFTEVRFDYAILDEAQAIKNAASVSAKAVRLLQSDHRLALSGTPIENHLGELWSLFEFLNPGMLGTAAVFKAMHTAARTADDETRRRLAHALRPFLLRRTKQQVIEDLPPKVEQTLYCELESEQRKRYDELRDHYRAALLARIEREGIGRVKIQILEALLRLRQAAIHPGLLDTRRAGESSAKLDMLLPRLREVLDEGHKTLVFSQFTGMLAIVRQHLDREGIAYEYLDGKTRKRQACVTRFQSDPGCKLFLISLKAGGLGLNLTAAQYVFLLDPWWNPAVEAQAVDRAHRLGQTNRVFAYRLIARDTIEEKVLELQNAKRDLADAIISADSSLIRTLGKEDLQLLLS